METKKSIYNSLTVGSTTTTIDKMPKKKITIEDIAGMIKRGFDETAKKNDVEKRFTEVEKRLDTIENRVHNIEEGQEEIKIKLDNFPYRFELRELEKRVSSLEKKITFRQR